MAAETIKLPQWVTTLSLYCSILASLIIFMSIFLHLRNYRKPLQQRLMLRINLIVPLFALSCYSMLVDQKSYFNKFCLEPIREVYEAFVIYTFFSLLTHMLGGEKNIIVITSGREPVSHPGFVKYILNDLDISDSHTFLAIKRGILQYVWLKPFICIATILLELFNWYDVNDMSLGSIYLWLTLLYNFSVSLSLYCLAMFWKILWQDLKPFKPVGKFLCVKLIIFASYWQGILLAILNFVGILGNSGEEGANIGISIQNALLCVELIAFAIGHWLSFSYKPFVISNLPTGRVELYYAFKDMIGIRDLIHDFKLTFHGDYYTDYKRFDSVEAMISHPDSKGTISRINQGMRYHSDGKQKHWLPLQSIQQNKQNVPSTSEASLLIDHLNSEVYAPSIKSNNTSIRALYSPASEASVDTSSIPDLGENSITDMLNSPTFNYDDELLDADELYYQNARKVINKYRLDLNEVKRILNYPIVDELITSHMYGFQVKQLRANRTRRPLNESENDSLHNSNAYNSIRYGSVV